MADKDYLNYTPKQLAYFYAADFLSNRRVPTTLCTPQTAKLATAELKKLSERLHKSAFDMGARAYVKRECAKNPKMADAIQATKDFLDYCKAEKTQSKIMDKWAAKRAAKREAAE